MVRRLGSARTWALVAVLTGSPILLAAPATAGSTGTGSFALPVISPITEFSKGCPGQNAEVEQAVDPVRGFVYEEWMGCDGRIGVATSADGGLHFGRPVVLAKSFGAWDPSIAVGPNGTVYAAFVNATAHHTFPVVEASFLTVRRSRKPSRLCRRRGTTGVTATSSPSARAARCT